MRIKRFAIFVTIMLHAGLAVAATAAAADRHSGTWKLNPARSNYSPGPEPKSTILYIRVNENGVKVDDESVNSDGSLFHIQYDAKFDGKDYPVTGLPYADTVSVKRIDADTIVSTWKKGGQDVITVTSRVSKDGQTRTAVYKGKDAQGHEIHNVVVYDKQSEETPREENTGVIRVFYGTDRSSSRLSDVAYGSERSVEGKLSLGFCDISIPRDHRMGTLERPSVKRFEFREDSEKHVVVLNTVQQSYADFYRQMKERIVNSQGHEAFIFVHGYDVSFFDAARRTGQMAYDLGFDGAPIFYSWPSQANLASYIVDENNIDWTTQHLVWFVQDVVRQTQPSKIHLIAHSMGSRALVHVLTDATMRTVGSGGPPITEVIFMAPDMDADTFKQFAQEFHGSSKRVTLYASSNDEALKQSQKLHGNPRAGESGKSLVLLPGVDTIDASAADTSAIGHWYYAERRSVLSDLFYLFKDGKPASERFGLVQKRLNNMVYYYFKP